MSWALALHSRLSYNCLTETGIPLAGVALSVESAKQLLEKGYRGLFFGFDWMVLQRAIAVWVDGLPQVRQEA